MIRKNKTKIVSKIRRKNPYGDRSQWESIKNTVKKRDRYTCVRCGSTRNITVDHIIPVSKGGQTVLHNLRCLCKDCHVLLTRNVHAKKLLKTVKVSSKYSSDNLKDYL